MTIGAHQPPSEMCLIKMIIYVAVIMLGMSSSIANVRKKAGFHCTCIYL